MAQVTVIEPMRRRRDFVLVRLDDGSEMELHHETVALEGLAVGGELDAGRLIEIGMADARQRCRHAAWRLLSLRPRAEKELERSLRQRGHAAEVVREVVAHLVERGFLNDLAYARQFAEERVRRRQGTRLAEQELRARGVEREAVEDAIASVTDRERDRATIRELLARWDRRKNPTDSRKRVAAAAAWLMRRGFESDLVWEAIRAHFQGISDKA